MTETAFHDPEKQRQAELLEKFLGEEEAHQVILNIVPLYPTLLEAIMLRILALEEKS
jgi:hypothetical protein